MCKTKNCFTILLNKLLAHREVFNKKKCFSSGTVISQRGFRITHLEIPREISQQKTKYLEDRKNSNYPPKYRDDFFWPMGNIGVILE
jgi:hypothetical protein